MNLDKPRRIAIAAVLATGLTGAMTVAGITAASSDPGSQATVTTTEPAPTTPSADSTDTTAAPDSADCERYAEQFGMGDHADMDQMMDQYTGDLTDMMDGASHADQSGSMAEPFIGGGSGIGSMGS